MFTKKPISIEKCRNIFDNIQGNNNLEKLIAFVNYEILNVIAKNKIIKSNRPILALKFSMHFGITKNLILDNLKDLQILIIQLMEVFEKEKYWVNTHHQSDGTIIFTLSLPYNIEPTFV